MCDDIVSLVRRLHAELVRTGGSAWNDVADEIERLRQAERALADQLAGELRVATEYADWPEPDHLRQARSVLAAYEEARRG